MKLPIFLELVAYVPIQIFYICIFIMNWIFAPPSIMFGNKY